MSGGDYMFEQGNLFDIGNTDSGFRLFSIEIYNWGTFNNKIWKVSPDGNDSLLTGENGSGKSTIIDALLTLLVKNKKRNYNLSSGSARRERSEETYCRGAYGKIKDEFDRGKTCYLRDKKNYSVLIGNFKSNSSNQEVSIGQFFWFEQDQLKKIYFVGRSFLSIKDHFSNIMGINELRARLKKNDEITVFSTFTDYENHFRHVMGIRSEKAMDLFNQIVSIKDIDRLNEFIRQHMIEPLDINQSLDELYGNYLNLTSAYDAIKMAREQLEALVPIVKDGSKYINLKTEGQKVENAEQVIPAFIATKKNELLSVEKSAREEELPLLNEQFSNIESELEILKEKEKRLDVAILNDRVGQEIKQLETDQKRCLEDEQSRKKNSIFFNESIKKLEQREVTSEEEFYALVAHKEKLTVEFNSKKEKIVNELYREKRANESSNHELSEYKNELESLKKRKNLIPIEQIRIRNFIVDGIGADNDEFPFLGELIKVDDREVKWAGACERLLRSFALRILVPDKYYDKVNKFVNKSNLKGKLVYQRVAEKQYQFDHPEDDDHLFNILEFKADSPYYSWIQYQIVRHFDYICTDSMPKFERELRAITSQGLIKRDSSLHEKDDRFNIMDSRNYVLGWSNQNKILTLESLIHDLENAIVNYEKKIDKLNKIERTIQEQLGALRQLDQYAIYDDIDWKKYSLRADKIKKEIKELEAKNKNITLLKKELDGIRQIIRNNSAERDLLFGKIAEIKNDIKRFVDEIDANEKLLVESYGHIDYRIYFEMPQASFNKIIAGQNLTMNLINRARDLLSEEYRQLLEKIHHDSLKLISSVTGKMGRFVDKYSNVSENLAPGIEYLDDFISLKNTIESEALPDYEDRFKKLLNDGVIKDMATFKSTLERKEEEIEESIMHLNYSLAEVDYTPSTYIVLSCIKTKDVEIVQFKNMLKNCLPDVGINNDDQKNEDSFHKIKEMIFKLKNEDRWKAKVTDVRNWREYSAEEKYREDGTIKHFYSDSGGLSGGQKAKLAFTILAAAISYQYGLHHRGNNTGKSFRLVVIDEAFSKSDEKNSHYAMELFRNLGLQLIVVTPKDKIFIVEEIVKTIYLVQNTEKLDNSTVRKISMLEYLKLRNEMIEANKVTNENKVD